MLPPLDCSQNITFSRLVYAISVPRIDGFLRAKAATALASLSHCSSVCPSVTRIDQSKTVQARIIKSSPSAAWKTLVLGTVNLRTFERGHLERRR